MMKENLNEELISELRKLLLKTSGLTFDKALPLFRNEVNILGNKYGVPGDAIVHFFFDNYKEIKN